MATAIVPGIYDAALADEDRRVSTEDAYAMTRRLAREAGLLVGPSSGAALQASLDVARDLAHAVVVTIFPDGGERYLTERFWNEARPPLELTSDVDAAIRRHGAAAYPDECCGALLGPRAGVVDDTLALDNRFDGERRRRFAVTPDDYRRAEQRASETSRELLGFYHSHPDHPAVPSAFDLEHAWPNLSYAIVSVRAGRDAELRSWRLRPDRSAYVEELVTLSTPRSPSCP